MNHLSAYFFSIVEHVGYAGVFVVMALGNTGIPIGSEIILPGAGALVATGHLPSIWILAAVALLGEIVGASILYAIGYFGGRPFIERYLRRASHELPRVDAYYARYGNWTVLICRFIPLIRGISSLPAGISRMNVAQFLTFTFLGSGLWCVGLSLAGLLLGNNLGALSRHVHQITFAVALIAIGTVWFGVQRAARRA